MTAVAKKWTGGGQEGVHFFCPGCKEVHTIRYAPTGWTWNGSLEKPSFTPSVLVNGHELIHDENGRWTGDYKRDGSGNLIKSLCHSFVTDGRIHFLGDCTHALSGQSVDLPPWQHGDGE